MVKPLAVVALAALTCGAVGIGPRRGGSAEETAPSPAPSSPAPAPSSPAPAPQAPSGAVPRETIPGSAVPGRISGLAPSTTGPVGIRRREGVETVPRRHYWHEWGGRRYSHYYDGRVHWYGYPFGASFFWMRPWGGLWWAWDSNFSRWVYWNDGFWWWPGPGGAQYVFVYDGYYPYSSVRRGAEAAPPASPDASGAWTSPDGQRLVEITGAEARANLFDATTSPATYIGFLGREVRKVRFSTAAPGYPPTIAVEFANGAAAMFDYDGRRLDAARPAAVKREPPPADAPPPPPPGEPPPQTPAP